jgi:hypothetical protein
MADEGSPSVLAQVHIGRRKDHAAEEVRPCLWLYFFGQVFKSGRKADPVTVHAEKVHTETVDGAEKGRVERADPGNAVRGVQQVCARPLLHFIRGLVGVGDDGQTGHAFGRIRGQRRGGDSFDDCPRLADAGRRYD